MDTHEVINVCRGRRRYWRERFLELNSQQSELLARSRDALRRSRELLIVTNPKRHMVRVARWASTRPVRTEEKKMTGVRSQLKPEEQVALRRVALDAIGGVSAEALLLLQQSRLIEPHGTSWRLTPLGQLRLKALPRAAMHRLDDASDEIERILEKFTRQRR